jgi:helix-turn-helix protein
VVQNSADLDGDPLDALVDRLERAQLPSPPRRRRIREGAGVSLRTGAAALGVAVLTLRRWESGTTDPRSLDDAIRYAEFLDRLGDLAR